MQIRTGVFLFSVIAVFGLLQPMVASGQSQSSSPYSQGMFQFYDGHLAEAETSFSAASKADPSDPRPYFLKGLCQLRQGNEAGSKDSFQKGSYLENTAKGRLYNVSRALSRVQGHERTAIEDIRRAGRLAWRKLEEQKQVRTFGETVERQKANIAAENRIAKEGSQAQTPQAATKQSDPSLPSFSPIRPYTERGETEVAKVPNLSDENNEEFEFFRDEIGKTSRSTAEQARLKELESRIEYKDPMDRPTKDGQKFVNIYDPGEIYVDEEPFFGADDPDDAYKEFENNPIAGSTYLLERMIVQGGGKLTPVGTLGKGKKGAAGGMTPDAGMGASMGGDMMGGDSMMGGGAMAGGDSMMGGGAMAGVDSMMGGGAMAGGDSMMGGDSMAGGPPMGDPGMDGAPAGEPGMGGQGAQGAKSKIDVTDTLFKGGKDENPFTDKSVAAPKPESSLNLFANDLGFTATPAEPVQGQGGEPGMNPEGGPPMPPPDAPPGGTT